MSLAVASRYANALADVVLGSRGALQPQIVLSQLRELDEAMKSSSELRIALQSPAISLARKNAVMSRICEQLGMERLIRNFVFLIVRNRRIDLFSQMRSAFEHALDERLGIVRAEVISAADLASPSRASLEGELVRISGKQVRCNYQVDPALLGGVVTRMGSRVYDGSVRGQLEILRRKLSTGV